MGISKFCIQYNKTIEMRRNSFQKTIELFIIVHTHVEQIFLA